MTITLLRKPGRIIKIALDTPVAWKERYGGSLRIHAGEFGLSRAARVGLFSSGFSRGVSESSLPRCKRGEETRGVRNIPESTEKELNGYLVHTDCNA
jgi:hypothetical protein